MSSTDCGTPECIALAQEGRLAIPDAHICSTRPCQSQEWSSSANTRSIIRAAAGGATSQWTTRARMTRSPARNVSVRHQDLDLRRKRRSRSGRARKAEKRRKSPPPLMCAIRAPSTSQQLQPLLLHVSRVPPLLLLLLLLAEAVAAAVAAPRFARVVVRDLRRDRHPHPPPQPSSR